MPRQTKPFGPSRRGATRSRNKFKSIILIKSRKQFQESQDNMRISKIINTGHPSVEIVNNLVAKGASKSHHVPKSKGVKQPTTSILLEKQKTPSRSRVNGEDRSKETHALKRKREMDDASQPTHLKAMPGLVPKATGRLVQYSDSSSGLKKRAGLDKEEDITSAKDSTSNLEFPKDNCTTEGNNRQDEIVIDKENVKEVCEYHKEGETTKAKHTLSDICCNLGSISSDSSVERNMGQFANCMSKKRKEPLFEENPKALKDDSKQKKKLKQSRETRKDEAEGGNSNINHVGVEDETVSISKNDHAKVSMSSCVERQLYTCSKPIDKPTWSGIFKTDDKKYVLSDGHLSTKSCEKAWSLSRQLLKVVEVKRLSRLEVWPKAWEVSTPTADNIGIYFFPHEMRQDRGLDQLVREVMENDLALRAILGEAEMLIFPSILLPNPHQTFQRQHYLWGVFKRRQDRCVVVEEPLNAMEHCKKEKQQNLVLDQPNYKLPGEEPNQEMIQMADAIPLERHMLPPNESTLEVEASRLKGPTNKGFDLKASGEEGGQAEATPKLTNKAAASNVVAFPASHGQINPILGHTADRLMGFVVRKTPKLDRIIQELEGEGALVFAMQGDMVGAGSWTGSKAILPLKSRGQGMRCSMETSRPRHELLTGNI